jgi:hypothetical protein
MKRLLILAALAVMLGGEVKAGFVIGDIQIIGYRADAADAIAFVTWKDIAIGESLHFTDAGFFSDGTLRDSEDIMTWTATTALSAGSVIRITSPDTPASVTFNTGSVTGRLNGLSANGDQIFVGKVAFPDTGDVSDPGSAYTASNLLYGFNFNGAGWAPTTNGTNNSALPSALGVSYGNMHIDHVDNAQYNGPRTGLTIAQFKASIADVSNWTTNDVGGSFGNLDETNFNAVPEPTTGLLLGIGTLACAAFRRNRRVA